MRLFPAGLLIALVSLSPLNARAHLGLDSPPSRYGPDVLKTGPCGAAGGERTELVTYYEPGATIEVHWDEYVDHPGHYRISFDDDGDDDFVDPASMTELYSNDTVLLDAIADKGAGDRDYVATVTLPDVTCDNCTLQVIQVMYDKPPYTTPGNDIYYQCADLVLRAGGTAPDAGPGNDPGSTTGTGCNVGHDPLSGLGTTSMLFLLLACRLALRRGFPV
ncbi:MAG: SCE4755 family polysaccharide monooxygenase-like protein [Polyangiales bacterium]